MKLARAGYLSDGTIGSCQWTYGDGTKCSIGVTSGKQTITFDYRIRSGGEVWQTVQQRVPIRWTPCRFGGKRPWFVCNVSANGIFCGRQPVPDQTSSGLIVTISSADFR
jgi:hypothetical protein